VLGDRTRLRQVALNLISNAVKFTQEGEVRLDVSVLDKQVIVSVSDAGIGISPEEQSTIFNEFHRSKRSIESGSGGLGLGLAISRQLIVRHGGSIEVRSPGDLGRGSTFSFCLPILPETEVTPELLSAATNNLVFILTETNRSAGEIAEYLTARSFDVHICFVDEDSEWLSKVIQARPTALILETKELERFRTSSNRPQTVLVADDDPDILEMHSRLIEQTGRQVLRARNGHEALARIEEQKPDLILLDLIMPEMDGFAVLEALHDREFTRDIPVIILTAHLLSETDLERCNRGVASILEKGLFTTEETLKHVETALTREQALSWPTKQLIRKAMTYIHRHFSQPLTREEIADHIGISADYLTDCFRQELGITPTAYIRRYRIRQACALLRDSDQSITQIAMAIGFSDSAHFTRTFQREMKVTPRAFRHNKPT
jgi:AraC-like DNA-binding protein